MADIDLPQNLPELEGDALASELDTIASEVRNYMESMSETAGYAFEQLGYAATYGPATVQKIKEHLKANDLDTEVKEVRKAAKVERRPETERTFVVEKTERGRYIIKDQVTETKVVAGKPETVQKTYGTDVIVPKHLQEALPTQPDLADRIVRQANAVRDKLSRRKNLSVQVPDQAKEGPKMPVWLWSYKKDEAYADAFELSELPPEIRREPNLEARIKRMIAFLETEAGSAWLKKARPRKIQNVITKVLKDFQIERPPREGGEAPAVEPVPAVPVAPAAEPAAPAPAVEPVPVAPSPVEAKPNPEVRALTDWMQVKLAEADAALKKAETGLKALRERSEPAAPAAARRSIDAAALKAELERNVEGRAREELIGLYKDVLKNKGGDELIKELVDLHVRGVVREEIEKKLKQQGYTAAERKEELKKLGY